MERPVAKRLSLESSARIELASFGLQPKYRPIEQGQGGIRHHRGQQLTPLPPADASSKRQKVHNAFPGATSGARTRTSALATLRATENTLAAWSGVRDSNPSR